MAGTIGAVAVPICVGRVDTRCARRGHGALWRELLRGKLASQEASWQWYWLVWCQCSDGVHGTLHLESAAAPAFMLAVLAVVGRLRVDCETNICVVCALQLARCHAGWLAMLCSSTLPGLCCL